MPAGAALKDAGGALMPDGATPWFGAIGMVETTRGAGRGASCMSTGCSSWETNFSLELVSAAPPWLELPA